MDLDVQKFITYPGGNSVDFKTYGEERQRCGYPRRMLWDGQEAALAAAVWADCVQCNRVEELQALLKRLKAWEVALGGFEAPVWREVEQLLAELQD